MALERKNSKTKEKPVAKPRKKSSKPELVLKTEFSPTLAWMYPYLKRAKHKMPNLILPKKVRSFKPGKIRIMRVLGNAHFASRTVVLATHGQVTYINPKGLLKVKSIVRLAQAKMLDTLAHEVAHFHYPDHGYEHEEFTRAIFKTFGLKEKCPHCKGTGKIQLEGKY